MFLKDTGVLWYFCKNLNDQNKKKLPIHFRYEGEWVEGVKQGKGTYTFGNGDVFEGTYANNLRHGPGFKKQVDGEHREENWKEDKLVNFNVVKEKDKGK